MIKIEVECIIRIIALDARMPVAHGIPKLHKSKGNTSPCVPVLAVAGSTFHCISRWVDMGIRELLDQMTSYVKNSNDITLMLRCLNTLYGNMFLLTAGATAMCHNINT